MALTDKQRRFVEAYLTMENPEAYAAALKAGYTPKTAKHTSYLMLEIPKVKAAIEEGMAARTKRTQIKADYVLRQAVKLHERCMQEIRPATNRKGEQLHDEEGNALFVFNAVGAAKALELVGKHIDVQAFSEKHEVTGDMTIKITIGGDA